MSVKLTIIGTFLRGETPVNNSPTEDKGITLLKLTPMTTRKTPFVNANDATTTHHDHTPQQQTKNLFSLLPKSKKTDTNCLSQ